MLEAKVAESGVVELKCDHIKDQIERRMMKTAREGRVKFVLCAESGFGKLHKKNDTVCWCGRQWSQQGGGRVSRDCQMQEAPWWTTVAKWRKAGRAPARRVARRAKWPCWGALVCWTRVCCESHLWPRGHLRGAPAVRKKKRERPDTPNTRAM